MILLTPFAYVSSIFGMCFAALAARTLFYLVDHFDSTFKDISAAADQPEKHAA